ncbi:MAG: aspartate-semialdehyde dehydrogenase, partial [Christensenellales bacterium]
QAVSGAGVAGFTDLSEGINGAAPKKFPYPIYNNVLPHIDVFMEDGYTKEEWKMINETKKILHDYSLKVTATTVRVPVFHGHSESINIEFERPVTREGIMDTLRNAPGIILKDDVANLQYPMVMDAVGRDEVFVGRVRIDDTVPSGCNLWCVADNIRKGAASNAVQIAELLIKEKFSA